LTAGVNLQMTEAKNNHTFQLAYIILAVLFLIKFLPYLYPGGRFWGFNHLIFLPNAIAIIYAIIAVFALALPFFKRSHRISEVFIDDFSEIFFESKYKYLNRLIFVTIMGGLFTIFAAPTHFLGDGYLQIANLTSKASMVYKWSERGTTLLVETIQNLLGEKSEDTAITAFQLLSIFSGLVSVYFYFLIADILSENKGLKILVFCVLLFSGTLLLFFGYIESYPALIACYSAFIYFGLKSYKTGTGLIFSAIALIIGIALHFQMLIFLPAILFLLLSQDFSLKIYRKIRVLLLLGIAALSIIFILVFAYYYSNSLFVENIFLPAFEGKPMTPSYAIFSFAHIGDIVNQLILLSPLLPLLFFCGLKQLRYSLKKKTIVFLLINSLSALFFLFVIDPRLSMPRDWDLFSLCGFAPGLLFVSLLDGKMPIFKQKLILSFTLFLIGASLPYLMTNLNEKSSVRYTEHFINFDIYRNRITFLNLRNYYYDKGDRTKVDSLNALYAEYYPYVREYGRVYSAIKQGDISGAKQLALTLPDDRFSVDYYNMWTTLHYLDGDYQAALESSKKAIQLDRYSAQSYLYLGMAYRELGYSDSALNAFHEGYTLNPTNTSVLVEMISIFQDSNKYDSSIIFSRRLLDIDSTSADSFYFLTLAFLEQQMMDSARVYGRLYRKYGVSDPQFNSRWNKIGIELEKQLKNN